PSARRPCSAIFSRLPLSIPIVSSISVRLSWSSAAIAGAVVSFNSSSNSTERSAKLFTKLSGFLISWAMPAVNWPREAIFSAWIRLGVSSIEPNRSGGEVDGGKEIFGGFVVARGDGTELFEFAEEILDQMALFVEFAIEFTRRQAVWSGRDDGGFASRRQ